MCAAVLVDNGRLASAQVPVLGALQSSDGSDDERTLLCLLTANV